MDWAMFVVTGLATIAAAASAWVAVMQARAAKSSDRDAARARDESRVARDETARLAAKATAAFERQAEAQERANALKEKELTPPVWTGPRHISGDLFAVMNSSGRTLLVESIEVEPDGTERLIHASGPENGLYRYGDQLEFMVSRRMGIRVQKLTLHWRFEDEPESGLSEFIIPL